MEVQVFTGKVTCLRCQEDTMVLYVNNEEMEFLLPNYCQSCGKEFKGKMVDTVSNYPVEGRFNKYGYYN